MPRLTNIAVIPARGGSKRIVKKNIRTFHGKPIIYWAIREALLSNLFDRIIVSTDNEEIAQASESFGAEIPFIRPSNISDDSTSVVEVIRHAIRYYHELNYYFEYATLIYPTAPFIHRIDIQKGLKNIREHDFCISVTRFSYPIQRALAMNPENGTVKMINKENFLKRSQDFPARYHDAGQFVLGKEKAWLNKTPMLGESTFPIFIPQNRVQDIDSEEDWKVAEEKFSFLLDKKSIEGKHNV